MTTNKPNVKRYADMGCPEQICRVDTMHESDDGDFVLYEDYEALQAEVERLREDAYRYRRIRTGDIDDIAVVRGLGAMDYGMSAVIDTYSEEIDGDVLDAAIDAARRIEGES